MSSIHAASAMHLPHVGDCAHVWPESFGVFLWCSERAIPLGELCADCLIDWARAQPMSYWIAKDRIDGVKK